MKTVGLPFIKTLKSNLSVGNLIQVIQGPRQVGKTTGFIYFLKSQKKPYLFMIKNRKVGFRLTRAYQLKRMGQS